MDRLERYGRTASVGADGTDELGSTDRRRQTERIFRVLARPVRKRGKRSEQSRAGRRFRTSDGAKRTGDRLRFAAEYSAAAVGQLRRTARRPFPRGDRHQDAGRDRQARLRHGRRGYVSRINVSPGGFGKALYITHPDGRMTVYGHLERFTEPIEAYVHELQYARKTFALDFAPPETRFPVKRGEPHRAVGQPGFVGRTAPASGSARRSRRRDR